MENKDKNHKWEAAGSLTPELEGTPHSGVHKVRLTGLQENLPNNVMSKKDKQKFERGKNTADLNTTL